jgi:hypothetical protein
MIRIGHYNTLQVWQLTENGARLGNELDDVLLPSRKAPKGTQVGDELTVFVYTDSMDRPIATLDSPKAAAGTFGLMTVVDLSPHGAYLDWGLEKDLLLPFKEQNQQVSLGEEVVVFVTVHEKTNRPVASARLGRWFDYDTRSLRINQQVSLVVYQFNPSGAQVVVDGRYRGIVYHNETYQALAIGQELEGWIKDFREDDRLDISLQRLGHGATIDAKQSILQALKEADDGYLPFHDKSDAQAIKRALSMSKKTFKKAIGGLYKEGLIQFLPEGIRLTKA